MNALVIRCRSCTPASTVELTDWLEAKVADLREQEPRLLIRLTRLRQELADAAIDDGWLIEVELPADPAGGLPAPVAATLEEALRDMRILGLAPTVLVPARLPAREPLLASAGQGASDPT